jgi:biopolymer transport protein ExbB/TolQ
METLYSIFKEGGVPLYLNVFIVSVVSVAIIVERLIALLGHTRVDVEQFTNMMVKLVKQGHNDQALKLCSSTRHPIAKVCRAGLNKADGGMLEISSAIDEEMMRAIPQLEKRVGSLWALANIATLIGLVGTIFGLITSFKGLEGVSPEEKSAFLARGISEALNNSAVGLTIAVVCMIGHLLLTTMSKKIVHSMELNASVLENFLLQRGTSGDRQG